MQPSKVKLVKKRVFSNTLITFFLNKSIIVNISFKIAMRLSRFEIIDQKDYSKRRIELQKTVEKNQEKRSNLFEIKY